MPWVVGIDEAGYGPNLGPFVMASVCCRVPAEHTRADFWHLLREVVRRHRERDDGRLLIEDSKVVYSPARSLRRLERNVMAALLPAAALGPEIDSGLHLNTWLEQVAAVAHPNLRDECWYHGKTPLPYQADREELGHAARRFATACAGLNLQWGAARCVVVCPPRFNALLERWQNKSVVLMVSLGELLQQHPAADEPDEVCVFVDKHGGRNNYQDVLRNALPGARVEAETEGAERSAYTVAGPGRTWRVCFEPRAEASYLPVALASMLAKYVRELLMLEFNHFWRQHLPDLEPTAGYPGDATRFMEAIRPVAANLGIEERALWRQK